MEPDSVLIAAFVSLLEYSFTYYIGTIIIIIITKVIKSQFSFVENITPGTTLLLYIY